MIIRSVISDNKRIYWRIKKPDVAVTYNVQIMEPNKTEIQGVLAEIIPAKNPRFKSSTLVIRGVCEEEGITHVITANKSILGQLESKDIKTGDALSIMFLETLPAKNPGDKDYQKFKVTKKEIVFVDEDDNGQPTHSTDNQGFDDLPL
jgi:hypothetical protein